MKNENYIALYRKYRPQTFSDVSGQSDIVSLLTSSIKQNKISHAYLFCGGRGTGKTTVARIFAREIGCNDEDIIEIDAASNRGIDEIRELREAVRTAPFSSEKKVYIIDEAHMLTKEAANALLKTLEEPPSHVIFILATTDPQKLPRTISSRCQVVSFKEPDNTTLTERITYIAKGEGFNLDNESASLISSHGNGSYRDAIGVLEQILNQSGKKVEREFVENYLGKVDFAIVLSLVESICKKEASKIAKIINGLEKEGKNSLNFYNEVLQFMRDGLLVRAGEEKLIEKLNKENIASVVKVATEYPTIINTATLLKLLNNYDLVKNAGINSWTAILAVCLSFINHEV